MKKLTGFFTSPINNQAGWLLIILVAISLVAVAFTLEAFRAHAPAFSDSKGMPWPHLAYLLISVLVFVTAALKVGLSTKR